MKATIAYISNETRWWDVDFYVSPLFDSKQLKQFVYESKAAADRNGISILEFTVIDGDKEIWRGLV